MSDVYLSVYHQRNGSGSAVAVGSSVLQDVAKHSRIVSRSHAPFLPPFVHCARVSKKMYRGGSGLVT